MLSYIRSCNNLFFIISKQLYTECVTFIRTGFNRLPITRGHAGKSSDPEGHTLYNNIGYYCNYFQIRIECFFFFFLHCLPAVVYTVNTNCRVRRYRAFEILSRITTMLIYTSIFFTINYLMRCLPKNQTPIIKILYTRPAERVYRRSEVVCYI